MRGERILGWLLFLSATVASAADSFPYKTAVKGSAVTVRSGPGTQFYATGHLAAGDEIEVYQRKSGGWLAIRPPASSFNWVEANKLRMTNDPDVAKVVGNSVVAWIGSELGAVEDHKWQVKLHAGEPVQLMSRQNMAIFSGDAQRDFYQIAPPAGDFRWVHERDIEPLVERTVTADSTSEIQLAQFQVVADATPAASPARDGFVARDDSSADTGQEPRVASLAPRSTFRSGEAGTRDFDALARQLDLALSETVSKEPLQWKLAALHQRAEALLAESDSTLQRGKARLLLEQIKEFEKLQRGYAGMDSSQPTTTSIASPPTSVRDNDLLADGEPVDREQQAGETLESSGVDAATFAGYDPRFDGRGWLLPVHSSKQASPPYALLDQRGQIVTFVSPAPGLNLHRYLRKEVGVFGQRSRAEFLNKPHLTADRIVDIDRHRR